MTRPTLTPGDEVGGYRIVSALGAGANGAVYRAVDGGGAAVAIKVLHAGPEADDAARDRLAREAATLHRLDHPAVADVLDVELDGAAPFIVTELIEGRSLEDDVAVHGPYDADRLAELGSDLADALNAVHDADVVHRDLKPSNVMVTARGPVLIDFGIAHGLEDARMTSEGLVMGTPGYLAPEMLTGASPSDSTDWWGWAATLAYAATGRAPFGVSPVDAVLARAQAGVPDLRGLGPRRGQALAGALRADPARRWEPETVVRELRAAAATGDPVGSGDGGLDAGTVSLGAAGAYDAGQPTEIVTTSPGTAPINDGMTRAMPASQAPPPPPRPADDEPTLLETLDDLETDDLTPGYERPSHARRAALLVALTLPFLAAATTWPAVSFGALAVLVVVSRHVGLASDVLHTRRERRGVGRGDGWRIVLASPWHLFRALLGALPALLVGGCVGLLIVVGAWWVLGRTVLVDDSSSTAQQNAPWVYGLALAGAMLAALLTTWFGPGARTARLGARVGLAHLVPGRIALLVLLALVVVGSLVLVWPALHGHAIVWWPFPGAPDID